MYIQNSLNWNREVVNTMSKRYNHIVLEIKYKCNERPFLNGKELSLNYGIEH